MTQEVKKVKKSRKKETVKDQDSLANTQSGHVDDSLNNKNGEESQSSNANTQYVFVSSPSSLCEICNIKPVEHVHHKDHNHKNNKKENLQNVCTLCHAKIHGIEPRYSELRRLVSLYTRTQKARIAIQNQIRGFSCIELAIPDFMNKTLENLEYEEYEAEKRIKKYFEGEKKRGRKKKSEDGHADNANTHDYLVSSDLQEKGDDHIRIANTHPSYVSPFPIYTWLKSIGGISHLLSGKLISHIDLSRTPSISSLRQYSGYGDPENRKKKGKTASYNHELKTFLFQLAESFIKQGKTHTYVKNYYRPHKAKQLVKLRSLIRSGQVKSYSYRGHAHKRAMRYMIKVFLKDFYNEMKSGGVTMEAVLIPT